VVESRSAHLDGGSIFRSTARQQVAIHHGACVVVADVTAGWCTLRAEITEPPACAGRRIDIREGSLLRAYRVHARPHEALSMDNRLTSRAMVMVEDFLAQAIGEFFAVEGRWQELAESGLRTVGEIRAIDARRPPRFDVQARRQLRALVNSRTISQKVYVTLRHGLEMQEREVQHRYAAQEQMSLDELAGRMRRISAGLERLSLRNLLLILASGQFTPELSARCRAAMAELDRHEVAWRRCGLTPSG
jgi:hypothetical protein